MPPAAKNVNVAGVLLKEETTYAAGQTLSASTDGFELWMPGKEASIIEDGYLDDGDMGLQLGGLGSAPRVPPAGKDAKGTLKTFFRGPGVAYAANVFAPIQPALKAAGYDVALDVTGGAEKRTYTPTAEGSALTSLGMEGYHRGGKRVIGGAFLDFMVEWSDAKPPRISFPFNGIRIADVTDAALPAITYPYQSIQPPGGASVVLVLGSFAAAVVRSGSFKNNREISNVRPNLNAAGYHAGYQPGPRKPALQMLIEETALVGTPFHTSAGIDHRLLREAVTSFAVTLQIGTAAYKRLKGSFPTCQLVDYKEVESNKVAAVDLTLQINPSSPSANDDQSWKTD
ncbi:MAG: hypothetical protein HOP28_09355 [Gemmatimonadales bacterium]|nr:hypothetical protein [Gemmatimonadales bacterium]